MSAHPITRYGGGRGVGVGEGRGREGAVENQVTLDYVRSVPLLQRLRADSRPMPAAAPAGGDFEN